MNLDRFIADRRPSWDELETLLRAAKGRPERIGAERMRRLGALYRGAAADLAVARREFPSEPTVPALEDLVVRAHTVVYGAAVRRDSVGQFFVHGYWRRVRERPALLAIAALLLFGPGLAAGLWAWNDPGGAGALLPTTSEAAGRPRPEGSNVGLTAGERASMSSGIFTNNIRVTFAAVAGGITLGLITAGVLIFNGVLVGVVAGVGTAAGNGSVLVELIVPHGVLEFSCIVVAGAAGLRMGWALVDPGRRPRGQALVGRGPGRGGTVARHRGLACGGRPHRGTGHTARHRCGPGPGRRVRPRRGRLGAGVAAGRTGHSRARYFALR